LIVDCCWHIAVAIAVVVPDEDILDATCYLQTMILAHQTAAFTSVAFHHSP
jgi:hypothetical protein